MWLRVVYITTRPGLFGLLVFFGVSNFLTGFIFVLSAPLVLSFTSAAVLGKILSVGGCGFLAGSLVMTVWAVLDGAFMECWAFTCWPDSALF